MTPSTLTILSTMLAAALFLTILPASAEDDSVDVEDTVKTMFFGDWQDYMKKGKIELVAIPEYMYIDEDDDDLHEASLTIEMEMFPGENWELELELKAIKWVDDGDDSEVDIGEIEASLEYRLFHFLDPVFDFRVGFEVVQPLSSASDGVTDGFRKYEPYISARTRVGRAELFGKIGYEFKDRDSGHGGDGNDELEYHFAVMFPVGDWRIGAELFGETDEVDDGDDHEIYLVPEVRHRIADDIEYGIGFPIGLTDDSADWGVAFNFYIGFDLRHGEPTGEKHNVFR